MTPTSQATDNFQRYTMPLWHSTSRTRSKNGVPSTIGAGMSRWPVLSDRDVKIVITGSRQYELHSTVLKFASLNSRIAKLLNNAYAANLSSKAIKRALSFGTICSASITQSRLMPKAKSVLFSSQSPSTAMAPRLMVSQPGLTQRTASSSRRCIIPRRDPSEDPKVRGD